jgi:hypothetical protein
MRHGRFALIALLASLSAVIPVPGQASSLETLLMPGKVSAAHAKLEAECNQCHDRSDRSRQAQLCMNCHKEVAADVKAGGGFHGRLPGIRTAQCKTCHTEHLGREAEIVELRASTLDHSKTDFALLGAHASVDCSGCHHSGRKYREAPGACVDCHREDDAHAGKFDKDCGSCHTPDGWGKARFDHDKTRYALRDRHRTVPCGACHFGQRFAGTPTECVSCHAPDDVHRGSRGADCGSCHTTAGWKTARYDHLKETGFALAGSHARLACQACHRTASLKDPLPKDCAGCHRAEDAHASRFGDACDRCHSTVAWKTVAFDHARDGKFELVGAHGKLRCHACHTAPLAEQKLGTGCNDCHRVQDVHSGQLGKDCAACHGTENWRRDVGFDHDLTRFTLVGMHVAVPCHECHASPTYKGAPSGCNDCHAREDRHQGSLGKQCDNCHSPNGWGIWEFDHARSTHFPLAGAHARVGCEGCHKQPAGIVKLSGECASCHARDDVHAGLYGRQCQRCHGTATFEGARLQ